MTVTRILHRLRTRLSWSAIALLAGIVTFALAGPTIDLPAAPWIAPLFLIRSMMGSRPLLRFLTMWGLATTAWFALNREFLPIPGPGAFIASGVFTAITLLPYLVHRVLAPRLPGFLATLPLPLSAVFVESLLAHPFTGTLFSSVYSQVGFTSLAQIASIAGIWPIIFLLTWSGAVVNWAWDNRHNRYAVLCGSGMFATLLLATAISGKVRASGAKEGSPVHIAAIANNSLEVGRAAYRAVTGQELPVADSVSESSPEVQKMQLALNDFLLHPSDPNFAPVARAMQRTQASLIDISRQQAQSGAQIVVWSEAAALVLQEDESSFISRLGDVARSEHVYLFAGLATVQPGSAAFTRAGKTIENKVLIFDPNGSLIDSYYKYKLPPGDPSIPGNGRITVVDTEYSRIAVAICYDLDSPDYIRQAGQAGASLLVAPSGDWRAIAKHHAAAAEFRAIENRVALVRPASHGKVLMSDSLGRTLAARESSSDITAISAWIPMTPAGSPSLYARKGNYTVYIAVLSLAALSILATIRTLIDRRRLAFRTSARSQIYSTSSV